MMKLRGGEDQKLDALKEENFYYKNKVARLELSVQKLAQTVKKNQIFTYMVIHDVKHPTSSLIAMLRIITDELHQIRNHYKLNITKKAFSLIETIEIL
jgi:hypothetical protein